MTSKRQLPLFEVDFHFIKVHRDLVKSGALARLGAMPFTILVALRSYVPMTGTSAFPSQGTLASATGLSLTSVKKGLNILSDQGWLVKRTIGEGKKRRCIYEMKEILTARSTEPEHRPDYSLTFDYGATAIQEQTPDVLHFARTGQLPAESRVSAQPINITIQVVGDHSTALNINLNAGEPADDLADLDAQLARLPSELRHKLTSAMESFRALEPSRDPGVTKP